MRYWLITLLLTVLPASQMLAAPPTQQPPGYAPFGFRPMPQDNARGTPPQTARRAPSGNNSSGGNQPAPYGYGRGYEYNWQRQFSTSPQNNPRYAGQPQPAPGSTAPYLETSLSNTDAYVQQTLILTLKVISSSNIATVHTQLPRSEAVVFRKMGTPEAQTRVNNGVREIVNTLHYLLTPLREGDIRLDPVRMNGSFANGQKFTAVDKQQLQLSIKPPEPGVRPWLPLEDLQISAQLINDKGVADGKPLTLIIKHKAIGATGTQLPSPEAQLAKGKGRLYREDSQTKGSITHEGKLQGSRVDSFTLIPRKGRALQIPSVQLVWWNTRQQRKEIALLPARVLNAGAGLGEDIQEKLQADPFASDIPWQFWLPLLAIAFFSGMYWTWLWSNKSGLGQRIRGELATTLAPARKQLRRVIERLSIRRYLHILRRRFAASLPRSYRLWFCVRAADEENDPAIWGQALRFLVQRRLGTPAQIPMKQLAEIIIDLHPGANPQRVRKLLRELDASMYGSQQMADFGAWKSAFKREIRPHLVTRWRSGRSSSASRPLPELNPPAH